MTIQLTAIDDCLSAGMFGFNFFQSRNLVFFKATKSQVNQVFSKDFV